MRVQLRNCRRLAHTPDTVRGRLHAWRGATDVWACCDIRQCQPQLLQQCHAAAAPASGSSWACSRSLLLRSWAHGGAWQCARQHSPQRTPSTRAPRSSLSRNITQRQRPRMRASARPLAPHQQVQSLQQQGRLGRLQTPTPERQSRCTCRCVVSSHYQSLAVCACARPASTTTAKPSNLALGDRACAGDCHAPGGGHAIQGRRSSCSRWG
jgi:hypothetical protein